MYYIQLARQSPGPLNFIRAPLPLSSSFPPSFFSPLPRVTSTTNRKTRSN
ncbi:unnamed protein product [Meloidogyne enterolobii]|uniref:Uncharacterized protein n=1 Tax=Meloidogyne enterolobii TaxID=390850 RepID=A0ACB0YT74_MELEN